MNSFLFFEIGNFKEALYVKQQKTNKQKNPENFIFLILGYDCGKAKSKKVFR